MSDVVDAPDFVQPATVDFSSLYEKAMAHPSDPTADSTPVAEPVTPSSSTVDFRSTSVSPADQKVVDLSDDSLVKVKVDGVEQTVPYREFKDGIQREAAFTKRMQQLADQRREAEEVFTQRAAELQRQAELIAYAQQQLQTRAAQPQAVPQAIPQSDPNEIATLGEVQQSLATFQQQLNYQQAAREQAFMQQLQQAGMQLREEQALEADRYKFNTALNSTLDRDDFRILKDVLPYADESIRFQVAQMDPQSIDEAITFAEHVAKDWTDKIRSTSADHLKRQEVAKARAKMEPPSGSPPPPQRTQQAFKKNGQIDWNILMRRAESMLDG